MNKRSLSESDICDRFISPALVSAGWDETRWRREYPFTAVSGAQILAHLQPLPSVKGLPLSL